MPFNPCESENKISIRNACVAAGNEMHACNTELTWATFILFLYYVFSTKFAEFEILMLFYSFASKTSNSGASIPNAVFKRRVYGTRVQNLIFK